MGIGAGTGIGGGPVPPQSRELWETTAFAEVMKKFVTNMLPPDTYEVIPFTQGSYHQTFKYDTTSSKPLLHPLLFLRMGEADTKGASDGWKESFQNLVNHLPADLKSIFLEEELKPLSQKDPQYAVLNNVLETAAKALDWIQSIGAPVIPGSNEENKWNLSIAFPFIALNGALDQSAQFQESLAPLFASLGLSLPSLETSIRFQGEIKESQSQLQELMDSWKANGLTTENQSQAANLSNELFALSSEASKYGALGVLSAQAHALGVVSQSIGNDLLSPSLTIGLQTALLGSDTPLFGKNIDALINSAASGLLTLGSSESVSSSDTFQALLFLTLGSIAIASILIHQNGIGIYPEGANEGSQSKEFTLALVLALADSSKAFESVFKNIAKACRTDEAEQERIATILKMVAILTGILAASIATKEDISTHLATFKTELADGLKELQKGIENKLAGRGLTSSKMENAALLTVQAGIDNDTDNYTNFLNTLQQFVELAGVDSEKLSEEFAELGKSSQNLQYYLTEGLKDQDSGNTTISQAV